MKYILNVSQLHVILMMKCQLYMWTSYLDDCVFTHRVQELSVPGCQGSNTRDRLGWVKTC